MAKDRHLSAASADVCESGSLLADLERRQDDVLAQLDALDRQLTSILKGLGVTLLDDAESSPAAVAPDASDDDAGLAASPAALGAGADAFAPLPPAGFAKLPAEPGPAGADQSRAA